jgi:succinate dehydrogenase / fumarate reductase membrane anchor subunit
VILLVLFLTGSNFSYEGWSGLFAIQWFKLATFAVIVCLLYHAWVGMRDIWMDYITHSVALRLVFQVATILWLVVCVGYAAQILWRV